MPPVDRWPASAPDPRLPKAARPQRDWGQAPWSDVAAEAAKRIIPTYASDMWRSVTAIPGFVGQTADALQGKPASLPAKALASGLAGLAGDYAGALGIPGHARPLTLGEAASMAHGVGDYVSQRYTGPGALKNTLATDSGGMLMDAQALASIPEGGEGFLGRLPGTAGRVGSAVGAGARTFNRFTNPVALAGSGIATGARAARTAIRGGAVLDQAGNFTPAALGAVHAAFPNGEITAAELANPKFKTQLAQTLTAKGANAAAVKEAVLAYNGAPTPRAVVTNTPAPRNNATAGAVAEAQQQGQQAIASRVRSIVGSAPDPAGLGAAVEAARNSSLSAATQKYEALRAMPGSFGPTLPSNTLNADIGANLAAKGMPSTPELLSRSKSAYPQANNAIDLVNDALVKGNTRLGGEVTTPEIMEVRRQLTGLQNAAEGSDQAAVGAVIDGLHQNIEKAAQAGQFQGPAGGVDISSQLRDANAAYKQHFDTFGNSQGPSRVIAGAVKALDGAEKAGLTGPEAHAAAARGIATSLANPTQGPATYSLLKSAVGPDGMGLVDDYIRQAAVTKPDGTLVQPAKTRAFLENSPMADVFTPTEQSDLRLAAAGHDVLNARPPLGAVAPNPLTGRIIRGALVGGAGAGLSMGASAMGLPHIWGEIPDILGASGIGAAAEQFVEPYLEKRSVASQLAGAPAAGAYLDPAAAAGDATRATGRALPVANALAETQPKPTSATAAAPAPPLPEVDYSTLAGPYDATAKPAATVVAPPGDRWPKSKPPPNAPDATNAPSDEPDYSTIPGPYDVPAPRASGGRVDNIERLVTRLQALAKQAQRASKKATEPLLNVPDAAITKALDVAQRAI